VAAGGFVPLLLTASDLSDPLLTARAARQVFFWLTLTLVALVALVAPGLTADVISRERATGTLEALVGTALRPREILTGKLLGAICVLLLLITPSLPLFGLCYLFHGASGLQVAQVYGLLTITLSVCALIGVTQSSIHARAGMAKFWAYASTALFVAFPGGPLWLAAWAAAPQAEMRQALASQGIIAGLMTFFYVGFLVLFWGNACEQLEYSEY
jgi:ABC-type Na+ efflux pump permease subunit